jgi:Allene oxide cyclase barrel like domain
VGSKLRKYVAVLAVIALGVLAFGSAPAAADGKSKKTLKLTGVENQFEFIDVGDPGPSLGDYFVSSETLFRRGRDVGTSHIVCTITEIVPPYPETFTFHCVATFDLERGDITLQGVFEQQGEENPEPFTVAITGGTGKYRCACGEAKVRVGDERTKYKLKIDFCNKHQKKKHDSHKKNHRR